MLNIGPQELIVVLIIALLVVGPSRLPELGRSIGKALREFRKVQDEVKDTFRFDLSDEPVPPPRPHTPRGGAATSNGEAQPAGEAEEPDVSAPPTAAEPAGPPAEATGGGSAPEPSA